MRRGGRKWEVRRRREMHGGSWWVNLRERDHLEDPSVDGRIILTDVLREQAARIGNVKLGASVNTEMM